MREATRHRIHSYYRIKSDGPERLQDILAALSANHPVVFGTAVEQDFLSPTGPDLVGPPQGATIGGHAMIIVGYNASRNAFLVKNSWGDRWRTGGYVLFSPDYLTWAKTWDLWVPTLGVNLNL